MNSSLTTLVTGLLLALPFSPTNAAIEHVLTPGQSIAAEIQNAHTSGDFGPRFRLYAERADSKTNYDVRVHEAVPSITSKTTLSIQDGESSYVNEDDVATMLVSEEVGVLALIAAEKKGGRVHGIVQKNGEKMKFTQNGGGGKALISIAKDFKPPAWSCGSTPHVGSRSLSGDDHDDNSNHFDHNHNDHSDHNHHDHSDHDHSRHFVPSNPEDSLADLQHFLRGSDLRIGKRRRVQGASYAYWVDVYVEIDYALCTKNGETCATGIGPNTINYVNAIFTGANTIYETEINTHLNVLHMNLNTNYDSSTSTSAALTTMRTKYAKSTSVGWHYTSPSGIKPDLHHALLSKSLGGGIAYIGVICNSNYGFGLSASLSGTYSSMGNAVVWDMMVFMHELGHNFNSGHTHESGSYTPVIDTCGTSCPSQLPLAKSSTIMSYCHLCSGNYANMDYTFGGKYRGAGHRSDINSYNNSALAGTVSTEPRRVNAKMWEHVSTRGTCTAPPPMGPPTTSPPTSAPSPCNGMNVEVKITTDDYPAETTWTLSNECGIQISTSGGPYSLTNTLHTATMCLLPSQYKLTINDAYGDGICCDYGTGSYAVVVDGVSTLTGGKFGLVETKTFGTCDPSDSPAPTTVSPTIKPTSSPTRIPTSNAPTPRPTSRTPTPRPTTTSKPTTRKPTNKPTAGKPTRKPTRKPTL